jgi:putative CocE/NonD family hydrolase
LHAAKFGSGLSGALCSLMIGLLLNPAVGFSQASSTVVAPVSAAALEPLVGQYRYEDEPDIVASFSRDGDHLYVENPRARRAELVAASPLEFSVDKSPVKFVFVREANGKVTSVKRIVEGETTVATKISDMPVPNGFRPYDREDVMIPMRDGVKLHAVILRPQGQSQPVPILLERTPYGVSDNTSDTFNSRATELAHSGYIFVAEDIRGRYRSEGSFVMMRPIVDHKDAKQVDESTDAYDTVDWLIKNVAPNNGRVGVLGVSYPGFLTAEAGIDPHPAVKAISPQAPMTDVWMGDDFFHNGAFRQTYGYDYVLGLESNKENSFSKLNEDAYTYFLGGSFASAVKKSGSQELPTWKGFKEHPAYDSYWSSRAVQPHLTHVAVPTLEVGGWWDQEDLWGPQAEYAALQPHNTKGDVFLVLGPWNHGGWVRTTRHLGALDFGAPVGDQYRKQIEAPFFAHYLKDEDGFDLKNTATFQTGSNQWKRYAEWPPREGIQTRSLFLQPDGMLNFEKPQAAGTSTAKEYVSDPTNPVPYRKRPIQATYAPGSKWYTWLVEDQRPFNERKDVATWSTAALDHDVTVTGDVMADLFASTSGTDGDWVVKLIDVYPDEASQGKLAGFELMIVDEIFRGRYRKSYEKPVAATANKVEEYKFSLHAADHVFQKGHKIMVQVQSSWFPLYDRNPQTYVPNIMTASPSDYKIATEKIYGTREYPSRIELPIAK